MVPFGSGSIRSITNLSRDRGRGLNLPPSNGSGVVRPSRGQVLLGPLALDAEFKSTSVVGPQIDLLAVHGLLSEAHGDTIHGHDKVLVFILFDGVDVVSACVASAVRAGIAGTAAVRTALLASAVALCPGCLGFVQGVFRQRNGYGFVALGLGCLVFFGFALLVHEVASSFVRLDIVKLRVIVIYDLPTTSSTLNSHARRTSRGVPVVAGGPQAAAALRDEVLPRASVAWRARRCVVTG